MSYQATVFKVMIASPGDILEEKKIIREVLHEWNDIHSEMRKIVLLPVAWDTHSSPEMGDRTQAIINEQLKDCDLLVGVFWTRIGTATGEYASGTVEEIEEHIKKEKPAMLYFSSAPVRPGGFDHDQYSKREEFEESCKSRGLYETYSDTVEFKGKFGRQLQLKLNEPYFTESPRYSDAESVAESNIPKMPKLSREAQTLLKEASQDRSGSILRIVSFNGSVSVKSNNKEFVRENNPRERAKWEGAIKELEKFGLIEDVGDKRISFKVSREGFDIAELITL